MDVQIFTFVNIFLKKQGLCYTIDEHCHTDPNIECALAYQLYRAIIEEEYISCFQSPGYPQVQSCEHRFCAISSLGSKVTMMGTRLSGGISAFSLHRHVKDPSHVWRCQEATSSESREIPCMVIGRVFICFDLCSPGLGSSLYFKRTRL